MCNLIFPFMTQVYKLRRYNYLTLLVHLKTNGGPSKKAALLSSEPVAMRKGRDDFQDTELMAFV